MSYLFKRPEEPRELSQDEIRLRVAMGAPFFCGVCGEKMNYDPRKGTGNICKCIPRKSGLVASFRIAEDKIIVDILDVSEKEFDPGRHAPLVRERKRMFLWRVREGGRVKSD